MKPAKNTIISFYENLGKLFYAIAAADNVVEEIEFKTLKKIVKNKWTKIDSVNDDYHSDAAYRIETVFDWLNNEGFSDSETCYEEFMDFKKEHPSLFTDGIKSLILKTAIKIANSVTYFDESEILMVEKLELELEKVH
ncbi:hypothetical protein BW723_05780 [Polaribacter reichenbachii]|uniref:Co-chaperone DjlA N-terminal domain-containing protein n=1 Tax=Polaribacter reichenbachii TaxID=996801 RepID=A0A1B8TYR1_9FLAO|nr:hypothetical protein [Polaribacter reichenbachii]APZ45836.1 hypothetical protein BW723_05780 [Polaribacter reichenbachii]AUC19698.1 hypothetical protein BTO17_13795 [Polaribacter reichenbachii]OBY64732.1 hypothetical protein LPB301_09930 [Polaribacter reichenbachii]